jgi:hypothetical protein
MIDVSSATLHDECLRDDRRCTQPRVITADGRRKELLAIVDTHNTLTGTATTPYSGKLLPMTPFELRHD